MNTALNPQHGTANAIGVGFGDVFCGIRVLESSHCQERIQYRFPRSKKKRIRAKWAKREENHRYEPRSYRMGSEIICHPSIAKRLREEMPQNAKLRDAGESGVE